MKRFKEFVGWGCRPERLFVWGIIVLAIPNVALFFTEQHMSLLARICNVLLPVSVYGWVMTWGRTPGKAVWALSPFLFLAAFQLVLLYLFGESIIAVDMFLNLATTNAGEAMELLDNLIPAVVGVVVVYVPALAIGGLLWARHKKLSLPFVRRQREYALAGVGAGVLMTLICYATQIDYRVLDEMYPINVCNNLLLAIDRNMKKAGYEETSKGFTFGARTLRDANQPEVYMLVIGETARACNWGLYGYHKDTTPRLGQTEGLVAFTDVITQSNTTHKSVPMLLSAASAEDYECLYRQKGILMAFREAGFHTAFFSNQLPNHSFIDFFGKEADDWKFIRQDRPEETYVPDEALLPLVEQELRAGHRKLFIVLHVYGSHFNYKERYPESMAFFQPDNVTDANYRNRSFLMNAYDNTIRYTDGLLASLIALLRQQSAVSSALLYTSDHGEDLFDDDRKLFLHASPVPSYYQLHVPFFIWTSSIYRKQNAEIQEAICRNKEKPVAANASVFPTMLHLAGIYTPYRVDSLSVASIQYLVRPRHYLNDHNLPKPLDKIGLKKEDMKQFIQHGLAFP